MQPPVLPTRFRRRRVAVAFALLAAGLAGTQSVSPERAEAVPAVICFPVAGTTSFVDTFGAPRSGGRTHEGQDLFGSKLTPIVATVDGIVDRVRPEDTPLPGRAVGIKGEDGWRYLYLHLNNDRPGTDDGQAQLELGILYGLQVGDRVYAGQVLGWRGDSGNAETTPPHVHFEIRDPDNVPINPYQNLLSARRTCPRPQVAGAAARVGGGGWSVTTTGHVVATGGAPFLGEPNFGFPIARAIAAMPDGEGYVVLDGWGGVHRYGSAVDLPGSTPYWRGWDIARDIEIARDGQGYVVLDGWGGVHTTGSYAALGVTDPDAYWPGWDIARDVEPAPSGRGFVVLDGWGGLHPYGSARRLAIEGLPYWPGWDIARDLELTADGAYLLDGQGGVHQTGTTIAFGLPYGGNLPWADLDVVPDSWVAARVEGLTRFGDPTPEPPPTTTTTTAPSTTASTAGGATVAGAGGSPPTTAIAPPTTAGGAPATTRWPAPGGAGEPIDPSGI